MTVLGYWESRLRTQGFVDVKFAKVRGASPAALERDIVRVVEAVATGNYRPAERLRDIGAEE